MGRVTGARAPTVTDTMPAVRVIEAAREQVMVVAVTVATAQAVLLPPTVTVTCSGPAMRKLVPVMVRVKLDARGVSGMVTVAGADVSTLVMVGRMTSALTRRQRKHMSSTSSGVAEYLSC